MQPYRNQPSRIRVAFIAATVGLLAACSSKPEAADIQNDLAEVYACPLVELADVQKVDGAEVGNKFYDVAFTHTMKVKGGKEAAAKLFAEWSYLESHTEPAAIERDRIQDIVSRRNAALANAGGVRANSFDDPDVKKATEYLRQLRIRSKTIMPCETMEVFIRLTSMRAAAEDAVKSGQAQIPVPIAIKLSGFGRMAKAESGWHFTAMPTLKWVEIVSSEPMAYPSFEPPAAAAPEPTVVEPAQAPAKLAADATASGSGTSPSADTSAAASLPTQGPSFDCTKASTAVEKMICADPKLAQDDTVTVALFKTAVTASANPDAVKLGQSNWRKNVRDACADDACLRRVYQERQQELK